MDEVTPPLRVSRDDGVALVEMVDHRRSNALGDELVRALDAALRTLAVDQEVKVIVLAGLPEVFSSGASREVLTGLAKGTVDPVEIGLAATLLQVPLPTIAAMEGHAVGGGLALGLCADIVLLARESRYGATFMNMGFTPGMGATALLEHVFSRAVAHELLFTGELRLGRDLERCGGVNYVLPRAEVRGRALAVARRVAEKPRRSLELLKMTLAAPRRRAFDEARVLERLMHSVTFAQPETLALIDAEHAGGRDAD
jgi:polyketide biosynthesis enoyl-CoA hydratase PksI